MPCYRLHQKTKTKQKQNKKTTTTKNLNVGMHSDVYESIWFKLARMIYIIKFYVSVLVYVTLTLVQGHNDARKQKLLHKLSHKVFNLF